jgi:hypothetical protein
MPTTLGDLTQTLFFKGFSGELLYEEFVANSAIEEGQLVKLRTDGKIEPIAAGDNQILAIGVAMQKASSNGRTTIAMRGFGTIMAEGAASLTPGAVKYASFTAGTKLNRFTQATAPAARFVAATSAGSPTTSVNLADGEQIGISLDATVNAGDQIRVVIRY